MRIIILSKGPGNYTTKRLKQAAKERGHKVLIRNYTKCYMEIAESRPKVHFNGKAIQKPDAIIPRIAAGYTRYGASVVRQFEMQHVYTPVKSIALVRSRDKLRAHQLMAREGIDTPKTAFAYQALSSDDIIGLVGGAPLIVKLARSTHGNGVVMAETNKAAKSVIQAFYSLGASFLIQEFIKEAGGTDIRAIVVGGRVVGAMIRRGLDGDFRSNLHQGGSGELIRLTKQEKTMAIAAAKTMGLEICGVDMIRSDKGPLVLEVNSSPGLKGIETATGKDIAGKMIDHIEKNAIKRLKKDRVGA